MRLCIQIPQVTPNTHSRVTFCRHLYKNFLVEVNLIVTAGVNQYESPIPEFTTIQLRNAGRFKM